MRGPRAAPRRRPEGPAGTDLEPALPARRAGAYGVVLKCYDKEENTYVAVKKFKGKEGALEAAAGTGSGAGLR